MCAKEPSVAGAHWPLLLANAIEPSICGAAAMLLFVNLLSPLVIIVISIRNKFIPFVIFFAARPV